MNWYSFPDVNQKAFVKACMKLFSSCVVVVAEASRRQRHRDDRVPGAGGAAVHPEDGALSFPARLHRRALPQP